MNESRFLEKTQALFLKVEDAVERCENGLDCDRSGNVLTIETEDGDEIVINVHASTEQVWLASRHGGYHFSLHDGQWIASRDNLCFWDCLNETLERLTGFRLGEGD